VPRLQQPGHSCTATFSIVEKRADYHKTQVAEAVARAKAEIAARAWSPTVTENYYANGLGHCASSLMPSRSQREAEQFFDITPSRNAAREWRTPTRSKAEIQFHRRQRDTSEAQLGLDKPASALRPSLCGFSPDLRGRRPRYSPSAARFREFRRCRRERIIVRTSAGRPGPVEQQRWKSDRPAPALLSSATYRSLFSSMQLSCQSQTRG